MAGVAFPSPALTGAALVETHRAGERRAEVRPRDLGEDDLLALVRTAARRLRRIRVREVLGGDVHAQALRAHPAAGDIDGVEESHYCVSIAYWAIDAFAAITWVMAWYSSPFSAMSADTWSVLTPTPPVDCSAVLAADW